jgi:hypothetical protein
MIEEYIANRNAYAADANAYTQNITKMQVEIKAFQERTDNRIKWIKRIAMAESAIGVTVGIANGLAGSKSVGGVLVGVGLVLADAATGHRALRAIGRAFEHQPQITTLGLGA